MLIALLLAATHADAESPATMPHDRTDRRAFEDLGRLYAGEGGPDLAATWAALNASDANIRRRAGEYLLALVRQSFEDESGRSTYSRQPPGFIEGPLLLAREFRKNLAAQLETKAAVAEAVPAIRWILEHDVLTGTQVAAVKALRAIHGIDADRLLVALVSAPQRNARVLVEALDEITARKLVDAAPRIPALMRHYRDAVRKAAAAAAGLTHPQFPPRSWDSSSTARKAAWGVACTL